MSKKNFLLTLGFAITLGVSIILLARMNHYVLERDYLNLLMPNVVLGTLHQSLFVFLLFVYGLLVLTCFSRFLQPNLTIVLAFIVGTLLWVVASLFTLYVGLPFKAWSVIAIAAAFLPIAYFLGKPEIKTVEFKKWIFPLMYAYAFSLLFSILNFALFSQGSYAIISLGESLAINGELTSAILTRGAGYPLATSMLFAPAILFDYSFSNGVYFALGISFFLAVAYTIYLEIVKRVKKHVAIIASVMAFVFFMSANVLTSIMLFNPFLNSISAICMFLSIYFMYQAKEERAFEVYFSAFFLSIFIIARVESIVYALILMLIFSTLPVMKKRMVPYALINSVFMLLWYFWFFTNVGSGYGSDYFVNYTKLFIIAGLTALFFIYLIFFSGKRWWSGIEKNLLNILIAGMVLTYIALTVMDFATSLKNIRILFVNVLLTGSWGVACVGALTALMLCYYFIPKINFVDYSLFAYLLFMIIIFMFRMDMPLRIGLTDSANRMMVNVIPLAVFITVTRLTPLMFKSE